MKFGAIPLAQAEGALLAHTHKLASGKVLKKGAALDSAALAALRAEGHATIIAARLEAGDTHEDTAARALAVALCGEGLDASAAAGGRVNLTAQASGLLVYDPDALDSVNAVDSSLTVGALAPFARAEAGEHVATIKVIPFAAPQAALAEATRQAARSVLRLARFRPLRVAYIGTRLAWTKPSLLTKARDSTQARVASLGMRWGYEAGCPHESEALAAALADAMATEPDLVLAHGAAAITDARDVLPAAVEQAGGVIDRLGAPIEPGNLLMLARIGTTPVLGLPGCARSPAYNGLDMLMERLGAGLALTGAAIARMGVGGFLRAKPRARPERAPAKRQKIGAVLLAAGFGRRFGASNKLLAPIAGEAMVRRVARRALAQIPSLVVVLGHDADAVRAALADLRPAPTFVVNRRYAEGMGSSIRAGVAALDASIDAAFIVLGDMPNLAATHLDTIAKGFDPALWLAHVPVVGSRRANPVLWGRALFPRLLRLEGDVGGRGLLSDLASQVKPVPIDDDALTKDADTPAALAALTPDAENPSAA